MGFSPSWCLAERSTLGAMEPRHLRGFLMKKHSPEIHQKLPSYYLTTLQKLTFTQVILKGSRRQPLPPTHLSQNILSQGQNQ